MSTAISTMAPKQSLWVRSLKFLVTLGLGAFIFFLVQWRFSYDMNTYDELKFYVEDVATGEEIGQKNPMAGHPEERVWLGKVNGQLVVWFAILVDGDKRVEMKIVYTADGYHIVDSYVHNDYKTYQMEPFVASAVYNLVEQNTLYSVSTTTPSWANP